MSFLAREFIKEKRDGKSHCPEDIKQFIQEYLEDKIPDYQMSAWLMASYMNDLSPDEASALTSVMLSSGYQFDFSTLSEMKVDKHSTGGVGDKTSMILAPIVAATGVRVPMIAGRGLGHTGGTLDKLEAISGFNTRLSKSEFIDGVNELGFAIMGQTEEICPADKRIYSLRDVTATIESVPLICASIMSKKLAEGINGLVMDVKVGNGAFMKNIEDARVLAKSLKAIALKHECSFKALITDMNQPLGRHCGNANEIYECEQILKNTDASKDLYSDCRELSLQLSSYMISLGKNCSIAEAEKVATEALESGKAWELFEKMVKLQGGTYQIQKPIYDHDIKSTKTGYLSMLQTESIGIAGIELGAGRKVVTDNIDPLAGIYIHKKLGDKTSAGDAIFSIFAEDKDTYAKAVKLLENSYEISSEPIPLTNLIKEII